MPTTKLDEQVVVVTGAGRGIGRAIAQGFGETGRKVAVLARTGSDLNETVALIEELGGCARPFVRDRRACGAHRHG